MILINLQPKKRKWQVKNQRFGWKKIAAREIRVWSHTTLFSISLANLTTVDRELVLPSRNSSTEWLRWLVVETLGVDGKDLNMKVVDCTGISMESFSFCFLIVRIPLGLSIVVPMLQSPTNLSLHNTEYITYFSHSNNVSLPLISSFDLLDLI